MIFTVLFYIFVAIAAIQIIYYFTFSSFLFNQKKNTQNTKKNPISIIIFAKNSADLLGKKLSFILEQNYPNFEVVLINNDSIDNTSEVLENFKKKNSNIKIINVVNNEAFWGSKKYALTLGIKAAKYEHLLFTGINSKPLSKYWLQEMNEKFTQDKVIVLGNEKYKKEGSLTNFLFRFENLMRAIQSFSFVKNGTSFMAFKHNFGYQKSTFFDVKGYINHMKIIDGEAELLLKDTATKDNVSYTISTNSFIEIDTPKTFGTWFQGLKKRSSIKKNFKFKHPLLLDLFTFTKVFFYVLLALLLCYSPNQLILYITFSCFLIQYIVIGFSTKKTKRTLPHFFITIFRNRLIIDSN